MKGRGIKLISSLVRVPRAVSRFHSLPLIKTVTVLVLALVFTSPAFSQEDCERRFDDFEMSYQGILDAYLAEGSKNDLQANMIDYSKLRKDDSFESLVYVVETFPKACLETQAQKIAFYLNAYNILSINKVAEHWPIEKLKSLGNVMRPVWTHPAGKVCNEKVTLRILEHDILRKLDEPRIHVALNCASMSCPDLRSEPYRADILEAQLLDQTQKFLQQEGKGVTHLGDNRIAVSSIFDWFEEDFVPMGGSEKFINDHLPEFGGSLVIEDYLEYDWDVNDTLNALERKRSRKAY